MVRAARAPCSAVRSSVFVRRLLGDRRPATNGSRTQSRGSRQPARHTPATATVRVRRLAAASRRPRAARSPTAEVRSESKSKERCPAGRGCDVRSANRDSFLVKSWFAPRDDGRPASSNASSTSARAPTRPPPGAAGTFGRHCVSVPSRPGFLAWRRARFASPDTRIRRATFPDRREPGAC